MKIFVQVVDARRGPVVVRARPVSGGIVGDLAHEVFPGSTFETLTFSDLVQLGDGAHTIGAPTTNKLYTDKQRRWYFANLAADKGGQFGGGGKAKYMPSGDFKKASQWAKENGFQAVPTKLKDVVDVIADGVMDAVGEMKRDRPEFFKDSPAPSKEEIANNYAKELRSSKNTWNGKPGLKDLSPELLAETQDAINANSQNTKFQSMIDKMGPQRVVVRNAEKLSRGAAEYRGGVTHVFDDDSIRALDLKDRARAAKERPEPKPGEHFHMTETEGLEATLRHEYGHQILDYLGQDRQKEFQKIYSELGAEKIKKGLTGYAAENHDELFAEMVALTTHPKYKRANFPDWVGQLEDTISGWVDSHAKTKEAR